MRARWWRVALPAVGALLAGCGTAPGSGSAGAATQAFLDALSADNATAACAWLAPETISALEEAAKRPCSAALPDEEVEPAPLDRVAVHGQSAFVRTQNGTAVFLARFAAGWRVTAAGCEPRPDLPYDCSVEGG